MPKAQEQEYLNNFDLEAKLIQSSVDGIVAVDENGARRGRP